MKKLRTNGKKKPKTVEETSSEDKEDNEAYMFCNELYSNSKSKEDWIQCSKCHGWAREACSNAKEYHDKFICSFFSLKKFETFNVKKIGLYNLEKLP